jgi:hypothetical protein
MNLIKLLILGLLLPSCSSKISPTYKKESTTQHYQIKQDDVIINF